jgi:phage-related protein
VLLHAFTKKRAKTPPAEIEIAERRMKDYLKRVESEKRNNA